MKAFFKTFDAVDDWLKSRTLLWRLIYTVIIALLAACSLFLLALAARQIIFQSDGGDPRITLLALVGMVGLPLAIWRGVIADQNRRIADKNHYTELYVEAVKQLGTKEDGEPAIAIRLGGLYALEKLMNNPESGFGEQIIELLCSYIREECKEAEKLDEDTFANWDDEERDKWRKKQPANREDIKTTLKIIGRRADHLRVPEDEFDWDNAAHLAKMPDLSHVNLQNIMASKFNLAQINFNFSVLSYSNLSSAKLNNAFLIRAKMDSSFLSGAIFRNAILLTAELRNSNLTGARLRSAVLGLETDQIQEVLESVFGDDETEIPEDLKRPNHWFDPKRDAVYSKSNFDACMFRNKEFHTNPEAYKKAAAERQRQMDAQQKQE